MSSLLGGTRPKPDYLLQWNILSLGYLELGDLQDYLLGQSQPLPEFEAQCIMSQILEGLDLMHENGYAHRDLKPNVSCKIKINY